MALYFYRKGKKHRPGRFAAIFPLILFVSGLFLIAQAVLPVVGWYFLVLPGYQGSIISPLASTFPPLSAAAERISYQPQDWFVNSRRNFLLPPVHANLRTYTLTIPKLKVEMATVEIGGTDLKKSLIAWPDSALPGNYGNNIIFGHSELPQLASPKSYSGIFTFLMDLAEGDNVYLDYDGIRYRYRVMDKRIVAPTDLSVLEQRFDAAYVTLITCVPPGTLWKRGIVRARMLL